MKKILSIILCLSMLLSLALVASAAEDNATISFADKANRTVYTSEQQVWVQNGITVTNDKAGSTSNVGDYGNPARFYKGSKLTVASEGMTSIVFVCDDYKTSYPTDLQNSISVSGATVTVDGVNVTVTFTAAVDSFVIESLAGQVRVDSITVGYGAVATHTHDASGAGYDDTHHWNICSCGDESTKTNVSAHTLVKHICECGYVATPTTVADIIACLYALPDKAKIPSTVELTGKVTEIDPEGWSDQYNNITVTMVVAGYEDYPIVCYRMKSGDADASTIAVGDTITVSGTLMNYGGTREFSPGYLNAITKASSSEEVPPAPEAPEDPKEIVDAAFGLAEGEKLPYKATLTGKVTKIQEAYSEQYKNITVVMTVEGTDGNKDLVCFRLKSGDADASKIAVGDTITVTGTLTNYSGTIEFNSGCLLDKLVKGPNADTSNPKDGDSISVFAALLAVSAIGAAVIIKKREF